MSFSVIAAKCRCQIRNLTKNTLIPERFSLAKFVLQKSNFHIFGDVRNPLLDRPVTKIAVFYRNIKRHFLFVFLTFNRVQATNCLENILIITVLL